MTDTPRETILADIRDRLAKATPTNHPLLKLFRYEHGGGRLFIDGESGARELIADFYSEGNREFYSRAFADIEWLLAECDTLRAQLAAEREKHDEEAYNDMAAEVARLKALPPGSQCEREGDSGCCCAECCAYCAADLRGRLAEAEAQLAAREGEIATLKEGWAIEREDATQWMNEEAKERKRADAAEARADTAEAHLRAQGWQALESPTLLPVWKCKACGCLWRDNLDDTVSLLNAAQKSCASCELSTMEACEIHWLTAAPPITKESQP